MHPTLTFLFPSIKRICGEVTKDRHGHSRQTLMVQVCYELRGTRHATGTHAHSDGPVSWLAVWGNAALTAIAARAIADMAWMQLG